MDSIKIFLDINSKLKSLGENLLETACKKAAIKYDIPSYKAEYALDFMHYFYNGNTFVFIFREISNYDQPFNIRLHYDADEVQQLMKDYGLD